MNHFFKTALLLLALLMPTTAFAAYDFEVDGIFYDIKPNNEVYVSTSSGTGGVYGGVIYSGHVVIPDTVTWEDVTYRVTGIRAQAFMGQSTVTYVTMPNSLKRIEGGAFMFCYGLKKLDIPNSVTFLGYESFYGCTSLEEVYLGNSVDSIYNYCFKGCNNLRRINFPATLAMIGLESFDNCNLDSVIVDPANTRFWSPGNNCIVDHFWNNNQRDVLIVGTNNAVIPNTVYYLRETAFTGRKGLTHINIPASVTVISERMFSGCTSLESITVDSDNPVFDSRENCNAIIKTATNTLVEGCNTTVIPNSVTAIGKSAFSQRGLTSFSIPNHVTEIGAGAFSSCKSLNSLTLSDSITAIPSSMCSGCANLRSITIPEGVTTIGAYAFSQCSYLYSINLPSTLQVIENQSFTYCRNLKTINFPDALTEINSQAFFSCSGLTSINFGKSIQHIAKEVFYDCGNVTSLTLPKSITALDQRAFSEMNKLKEVYCYIEDPALITMGENVFVSLNQPGIYKRRTLYVPIGTKSAYENDDKWKTFFAEVIPMGDLNGDGDISVEDVITFIDILLSGDDLPPYADVNGDGMISVNDVTDMISALLSGNFGI